MKPSSCCALLLLLALGCQSAPDQECSTRPGEPGYEIDCAPTPGADWGDRALDEAEEGMERRGPGGRP